jgi:UDP-glucose 4-epimerase
MKILITGDLGFVGSATKKALIGAGHDVIGYDIMDGFDIRDFEQLKAIVGKMLPDRILHLAAIARFSEADKDPKLAFETNALGTMNVAKVATIFHIPVVYSSTGSAIMPLNDYKPPFNEEIPARGNSIYGSTKAAGEFFIREAKPFIILRYGHLFGAEKRMHGAISGFLDRMKRGLAPVLYGGEQTNSFVYIKDVAQANVAALTANWDCWNQIYNIGSPEELTTEYVFEQIREMTGYKGKIEKKAMRTVDPSRFAFDVSKAERMLDFKPKYTFKDGLYEMLEEMNLLKG